MVEEYLERIGISREQLALNEASLAVLHRQHVLHIPFEVLDIHYNVPLSLELDAIYHKVIRRKRGGFCYELNYLFCHLLNKLGFSAQMVSSRIYGTHGKLGPAFDHMSIVVTLAEKWLVDVGYGDLFLHPINIIDRHISKDWFKYYQINKIKTNEFLLSESKDGQIFKKRYQFNMQANIIEDFNKQFNFKQYDKASYFVKNKICTLPNPKGRITIFNDKFIEKKNGVRNGYDIRGEKELSFLLENRFGIKL